MNTPVVLQVGRLSMRRRRLPERSAAIRHTSARTAPATGAHVANSCGISQLCAWNPRRKKNETSLLRCVQFLENVPHYQMIVSAPFRPASRFLLRCVRFSICLTLIGSIPLSAAEPASIHADFANVPDGIVDRSELLLGKLNCIACHQADPATKARLAFKQSPILGQEAITPQYLRKFLADPQSAKSGSPMPDLLHGMEPADRT